MKNIGLATILFFIPMLLISINSQVLEKQVFPGQIKFDLITVNKGLSQSTGMVVFQDSKGFLWFGTQDGLNKYDGYDFKIYRNNPLDENSLAANFILSIHEDQDGILWIGTNGGGMDRFDPGTEIFTHFKHNPTVINCLSNNVINSICQDKSGILWIGTNWGLNRLDPEKNQFVNYLIDSIINIITVIYEDNNGTLWTGTTGHGLAEFNRETKRFVTYETREDDPFSINSNSVNAICEDSYGTFWVGTNGGGLDFLDRKTGKFFHFVHNPAIRSGLPGNTVLSICESKISTPGVLWVGTLYNGLARLNREDKSFTVYRNNPDNLNSISNDIIFSLCEDNSGTIWVGTGGGGINKFNIGKQKFLHIKNPASLVSNFVWAVIEDQNKNIWIGSQGGGLIKFDRVKNEYHTWLNDPLDNNSLSNNIVLSLVQAGDGHIWVGTGGGGLNKFDPETGNFVRYINRPGNSASLSNNNVKALFIDSKGMIWAGTVAGGINKFDPETEIFSRHQFEPDNDASLNNNSIFSIYEDSKGYIWVGTNGGGLNKLDQETGEFMHFIYNPNDTNSLSNNRVRAIYEDESGGFMWIGTDYGLNKLIPSDRKSNGYIFQKYTTENGLPNNVIYSILPDKNESLWLSTNEGLSMFSPVTGAVKNYDVEDGLQSNEFNTGAYFKSNSGELFYGGINGINIFHPDSIKVNLKVPKIIITDIKLFNQSIPVADNSPLKKSIFEISEIKFSYRQNFLSFNFVALNFTDSHKNQYKYMLEGVDKSWVEAGTRRFADYPDLAPGKYVFRVIGSNNDGVWNEDGTSLNILIRPPWWKTMIVYFLYLLILTSGLFFFIKIRERNLIKEKTILEEKVKIRTAEVVKQKDEIEAQRDEIESQRDALKDLNATKDKFFAIIGHDLKNPFTALLSITESLVTSYEKISEEEKKEYISRLYQSTHNLYDLLNNLLLWAISQRGGIPFDPKEINLRTIVSENISLAKVNYEKKEITVLSEIEPTQFVFADKNMVTTVLRNLLSNAIKFTQENGLIKVSSRETEGQVEVSVSDSGIGIREEDMEKLFKLNEKIKIVDTATEKGTGLGLVLCKEFIEKNGGRIWAESELNKGSHFKFTLPKP